MARPMHWSVLLLLVTFLSPARWLLLSKKPVYRDRYSDNMSKSFNVIALISGGKDSIYSILHCVQNGHKVVALGNIYPLPLRSSKSQESHLMQEVEPDENDLNSHMYQTVGHTVIPLYEQALAIPLYRQPIIGNASASKASYEMPEDGIDETESLVPLLHKIIAAHPEANAVSTGAILSTYQRTRVESVAIRLGLVPLSFLWQYPCLFPASKISLLMDMASVGLDARIIKTASWSLDDSFLWQNVASSEVMQKIEKCMAQFGNEDGAALGEGGEFETLALDGPDHLFKGRIVVAEQDRRVIEGSSITSWVRINRAKVEMKTGDDERHGASVRIPDLLSADFEKVYQALGVLVESGVTPLVDEEATSKYSQLHSTMISLKSMKEGQKWTIVGFMQPIGTIEEEVEDIIAQIKESLAKRKLDITHVKSTLILLRSMSNFTVFNKIYGNFFMRPNPPARVTIACGALLPPGHNAIVLLNISSERSHQTNDLHVQSRSYWAPANIGPYSQARSEYIHQNSDATCLVHVAGQIPLVPSTMGLLQADIRPSADVDTMTDWADPYSELKSLHLSNFIKQTALSLQHLWRIGQAMNTCWWTGAVAYLSKDTSSNISQKAQLAAEAWSERHGGTRSKRMSTEESEEANEDERDPWEERYHKGFMHIGASKDHRKKLPDWSIVNPEYSRVARSNGPHPKELPPFFAAEVEELPRGSEIEWHALFGVTGGPIIEVTSPTCPTGRALRVMIANEFSQTFVFINYGADIKDLSESVDMILSEIETPKEAEVRRTSPGYHHSHTAYLDATIAGLWNTDSYAGVIPCRSLWGVELDSVKLERLAAVLVFQSFM